MAHWLAVTSVDNWARCLAAATWGVKDRFANTLKQVAVGDDVQRGRGPRYTIAWSGRVLQGVQRRSLLLLAHHV